MPRRIHPARSGNAGDAEYFAAANIERNVVETDAMRIIGLYRQVLDHQARVLHGMRRSGLHLADIAADHHARE